VAYGRPYAAQSRGKRRTWAPGPEGQPQQAQYKTVSPLLWRHAAESTPANGRRGMEGGRRKEMNAAGHTGRRGGRARLLLEAGQLPAAVRRRRRRAQGVAAATPGEERRQQPSPRCASAPGGAGGNGRTVPHPKAPQRPHARQPPAHAAFTGTRRTARPRVRRRRRGGGRRQRRRNQRGGDTRPWSVARWLVATVAVRPQRGCGGIGT